MNHSKLYRTLALAALTLLPLAGCESASKSGAQIKKEQYSHWNDTRISMLYQMAQQQYQVGDYDKCRETLAQAFALKYPHAPTYTLAAKVDIEKGNLETAAGELKMALQIDASAPEPYYLLGVVYQRWQNPQAAHDYYKLAFEKKPTESLFLLALVEMKITLGQLDEAQKLVEDKLVYFEQTAAVRVALAKLYTLKADYKNACKFYGEASILSPEDPGIRQNYAESLFFAQRYSDALPLLEDLHKNDNAPDKTNLLTILGRTYLSVHRPREARTVFSELTRSNPNDTLAWINLGKATIELNDYPQAAQIARRVLKADSQNIQGLVLLALSQQKLKQSQEALATLNRAHDLSPNDATVLCLLGMNAQNRGQQKQAADFYSQAIQLSPNDPWAQELLASAQPSIASPTR